VQIIFDPKNPDDCASVVAILAGIGMIPVNVTDGDDGDAGQTPATAGEVDSRGVPLLPEFHTGTKNKDGSWRLKKGVDRAAVEVAEKNARDANPVAVPAAAAPSVPGPDPIIPAPVALAAPAPAAAIRYPAPAVTVPPVPATPPMPQPQTVTYESLLAIIGEAMKADATLAGNWATILAEVGAVNANGQADNSVLETNETVRAALAARLRRQ
jgi:hypothetical protein